mmetsp:Transcript_98542/g.317748  ORF Transcript_98542/g.317748 Transcript_98542/m.317748 type:complete len:231 (-) Transcript_98542:871-1563(-)
MTLGERDWQSSAELIKKPQRHTTEHLTSWNLAMMPIVEALQDAFLALAMLVLKACQVLLAVLAYVMDLLGDIGRGFVATVDVGPKRHHLIQRGVVPRPRGRGGKPSVSRDQDVLPAVEFNNGRLSHRALAPQQLGVGPCSIPHQRQTVDGVHCSERARHFLSQEVSEHTAVALAAEIDATQVDAMLSGDLRDEGLNKGDVVVARRPIAPSALAELGARWVASEVRLVDGA